MRGSLETMRLHIERGHEVQTDRKGRPKGVNFWFTYRLEISPDEMKQIEWYMDQYHTLYDAPALQITVSDLLEGRHTDSGTTFELVLASEQAIRKAASRLVAELTARNSYVGSSVLELAGDDEDRGSSASLSSAQP